VDPLAVRFPNVLYVTATVPLFCDARSNRALPPLGRSRRLSCPARHALLLSNPARANPARKKLQCRKLTLFHGCAGYIAGSVGSWAWIPLTSAASLEVNAAPIGWKKLCGESWPESFMPRNRRGGKHIRAVSGNGARNRLAAATGRKSPLLRAPFSLSAYLPCVSW